MPSLSESMARMHCQEEVSHVRCLGLLMPSLSVQPSYALSVRVHGTHGLSGRGEPRTLPRFAYALSVSTTILCPLRQYSHFMPSLSVQPSYALSVSTTILCPLCQSMARMHCQEEVSHVRCLGLLMPSVSTTILCPLRQYNHLMPSLSVQPSYALSVSTTILCPLCQYNHLMPSLSVQPSYALSVSTTILCPLCQSMARMRCQEEVSHVRCLGLLMPSLSAQPSYALSVSTTILCPLCQYNHLMPSLSVQPSYALSVSTTILCPLRQYNHLIPSLSVQPSYALSVSTTILCPLCQSMARMHCQEEVSHVCCLGLLMPHAPVLEVSFQIKAIYSRVVLPSLSVQPSYALCQYNHLMPSLSVQPSE